VPGLDDIVDCARPGAGLRPERRGTLHPGVLRKPATIACAIWCGRSSGCTGTKSETAADGHRGAGFEVTEEDRRVDSPGETGVKRGAGIHRGDAEMRRKRGEKKESPNLRKREEAEERGAGALRIGRRKEGAFRSAAQGRVSFSIMGFPPRYSLGLSVSR